MLDLVPEATKGPTDGRNGDHMALVLSIVYNSTELTLADIQRALAASKPSDEVCLSSVPLPKQGLLPCTTTCQGACLCIEFTTVCPGWVGTSNAFHPPVSAMSIFQIQAGTWQQEICMGRRQDHGAMAGCGTAGPRLQLSSSAVNARPLALMRGCSS